MSEEQTPFQITKEVLKPWSPCSDGYKWFLAKFPQGGEFTAVQKALREDKRFDDARWLTNQIWQNVILDAPAVIADVTKDHVVEADEIIAETTAIKVDSGVAEDDDAQIGSSGNDARIGSSGYGAQIGSSGSAAQIGSSGSAAQIGSSGYGAQIGSSGNGAQIGSSGYDAQIGSSGNDARIGSSGSAARIGSSGNGAQIGATGENAIIASAGMNARVKAGAGGAVALAWHDGERARFAVGYVGEGLKADTWYEVNGGEFFEVTE